MKKIIILLFLLIIPITARAELEIPIVNKYINHIAYNDDEKVCDTWAYDATVKKYVKINENCTKIFEIVDPNKDPNAEHGRINIKAEMPDNLLNEKIIVEISSIPYNYVFELNKDNNFTIDEDVIATSYSSVEVYVQNHEGEYEIFYPKNMNVYKNDTSTIKLDYSSYGEKENTKQKKEKKKNNREIIIYIILGAFFIVFLVIACLFIKARNI